MDLLDYKPVPFKKSRTVKMRFIESGRMRPRIIAEETEMEKTLVKTIRHAAIGAAILLLLFLLVTSTARAAEFTGRVSRIIDGDTVEVISGGRTYKVRLSNGVDTPEVKQPFGPAATAFSTGFALDQTAVVHAEPKPDKYGRILGRVIIGGRSLWKELIRNGYAWHWKKYSDDEELSRLMTAAKAAKRGLWKQKNPTAPWEYRKQKRSKN